MNTLLLNRQWKLIDTHPGEGRPETLGDPALDTSAWLPISVPGDVNDVLVRAQRMPNPHIADNARKCQWVTAREWWMRCDFPADELHAAGPVRHLTLDGVDGPAEAWLNGQTLGRMDNAFRPWRFPVSQSLRTDRPNVLLVRFESIDALMGGPREDELKGWGHRRTWLRKPQFNFGWDWALPLPSIGIAGPVRIEAHHGPRLRDVAIRPFVSGRVDFDFEVNGPARDQGYAIRLHVNGHGTQIEKTLTRPGRVRSYLSLQIENPALWWPNGMGDQPLYEYRAELLVDGQIHDARHGRFGIREVRTFEEPFTEDAGPGRSFWFEVNGRRVFAKGANWIPLEIWPATANEKSYDFLLRQAREAHFNMMRIWGGGIYERPRFYELCDELGIMVWQDFMFASAGYSVDRLRDNIIAEASHQIRRLRNHPCIALWCGINEDVFSWNPRTAEQAGDAMDDTGVYSSPNPGGDPVRLHDDPILYTMILRGLVHRHGLGVPYTESSPQSSDDFGNTPESGNCHISCWKFCLFHPQQKYDAFREHFRDVCSFDSEFCIQGPPAEKTMRQFLTPAHAWPPDDTWTFHIQKGHRDLPHHEQTLLIAGATFGPIDSLRKYVKYGQATHVEQMRAEFESARRDRPNNGGTMMWMYNDCWPTANWSIIDYFQRPKPSYYAARRACAPLLPIVFERNGNIGFFLSNDAPHPAQNVRIAFGAEHLDGRRIWQKSASLSLAAMETQPFYSTPREELSLPDDAFLFIDAEHDGQSLPPVSWFPHMWKNVPWTPPNVRLEIEPSQPHDQLGCQTRIRLTTDTFARLLHLRLPESTGPHWFQDNFFDLPAHRSHTVTLRSEKPVPPESIQIGHWLTDFE